MHLLQAMPTHFLMSGPVLHWEVHLIVRQVTMCVTCVTSESAPERNGCPELCLGGSILGQYQEMLQVVEFGGILTINVDIGQ